VDQLAQLEQQALLVQLVQMVLQVFVERQVLLARLVQHLQFQDQLAPLDLLVQRVQTRQLKVLKVQLGPQAHKDCKASEDRLVSALLA
jgi:hypothetical protein